jgi:hypothetical protein
MLHPVGLLVIKFVPFRRLSRSIKRTGSRPSDVFAANLGRGLAAAAHHHPLTVTCLPQSLTTHAVLRTLGYESRIVIGGTNPSEFSAHAWVEVGGTVVGDPPDIGDRFAALVRLPSL